MTSRGGQLGRQCQLGRTWAVRARCDRVVVETVGRQLAVAGIRRSGLLLALVEVERGVKLRLAEACGRRPFGGSAPRPHSAW
ncbi:MAG: hypothetical protein ABSA52_06160 [Candidatus Binatia bacterium]